MEMFKLILILSLVCYSESRKEYLIKLFRGGDNIVNGYAYDPSCKRWTISMNGGGISYRTCQEPHTCFLEMPQKKINKDFEIRNLMLELDVRLEGSCDTKNSPCALDVNLIIYRKNGTPETLTVKLLQELKNNKFLKFFSLNDSAIIDGFYFRITPTQFCGSIQDVQLYTVICDQQRQNMAVFPDFVPESQHSNVIGKCIPNAVPKNNSSTSTAECTTNNGRTLYTKISPGKCVCVKGYTPVKDVCVACGDDEYKENDGNHKCEKCGKNTIPKQNHTQCECFDGFVRRIDDSNDDCLNISSFGSCPEEKINHASKTFTFPKTMVRQNVSLPCHDNNQKVVTRRCRISKKNTAKWKNPDWSSCGKTEKPSLQDLKKVKVTVNNAPAVSRALSNITSKSTQINTPSDLDSVTTIMENCLNNSKDREVVSNIMNCVDNVVKINITVIAKSKNLNNRILKILDDGARKTLDNPVFYSGSSFTFAITNMTDNRDFNAVVINQKDTSKEYCNSQLGIDFTTTENLGGHGNTDIKYTNMAAIQIPKSTLKETNLSKANIYVYAFKNDNLFPSNHTTSEGEAKTVVSYILATTVYNKTLVDLKNGILIKLKVQTMQQAIRGVCSYWKTSKSTSHGYWSTDGCTRAGIMTTVEQNIYLLCKCSHLTNFAVLFNVYNTNHAKLKSQHALNIVSFVGCTVSMVCLIATLVCYLGIREIRRKTARKILINFCFSLLCLLATFIFGINQVARPVVCHAVATLLHLFTLSTFCWMSVQAMFLYKKAVRATKNRGESHRTYKVSFASSWGFSIAMALATCYFTIPQFNGENKNSFCVMTSMPFNVTILVPVSFLILINYILFVPVIREIQTHMTTRAKLQKSQISLRKRFKVTFSCTTLLGLTWVFGFFAVDNLREPFQWLFCLSNSLQGMFIFIFHVLLNEKLCDTWKKTILPNSKTGSSGDNQSKTQNWTGSYRQGTVRFSVRTSDRNSAAIIPWRNSSSTEKTLSLVDNGTH